MCKVRDGLLLAALTVACGCGTDPSGVVSGGDATVRMSARIHSDQVLAKATQTTWNRLSVLVTAPDIDTLRFQFTISPVQDFIVQEDLTGIPSGSSRMIIACTLDSTGDTIHGLRSALVDLAPNQVADVSLSLTPSCGSIYINLSDFDASVDSVKATFTAGQKVWSAASKVPRTSAAQQHLSIDRIPYGTCGTLRIVGLYAAGDTVAQWSTQMVFGSADQTLQASFVTVGALGLRVSVSEPGVTVVEGSMNKSDSIDAEPDSSPVVITEIMYCSDSEYVELRNTTKTELRFDSLLLEIDGKRKALCAVRIPADSFFVVGRKAFPWVNASLSSLDLFSTSGNTLALRKANGELLDRVSFCSGSNSQGWVDPKSKGSIVVAAPSADPRYNNYGKNWVAASSDIAPSLTAKKGTPGRQGS